MNNSNVFAILFRILGGTVLGLSILICLFMNSSTALIVFSSGIVSSMLLFGFGEVINLLQKNEDNQKLIMNVLQKQIDNEKNFFDFASKELILWDKKLEDINEKILNLCYENPKVEGGKEPTILDITESSKPEVVEEKGETKILDISEQKNTDVVEEDKAKILENIEANLPKLQEAKMSERFMHLYELDNLLYTAKSPVIVIGGVLLKDIETNRLIIQLKFSSISDNSIIAIKIKIAEKDIVNKIENILEYQYLDLNVKYGDKFGDNKAILIKGVNTKKFSIENMTIVFDNKETVTINTFCSLPRIKKLIDEVKLTELEKQYRLNVNNYAKYVPVEFGDIWMCSCGEWNKNTICRRCKAAKNIVFSNYDIQKLNIEMNSRLREKRMREIEKEKKEELYKQKLLERELKRKKYIKVVLGIIIAVIFIILSIVYLNR